MNLKGEEAAWSPFLLGFISFSTDLSGFVQVFFPGYEEEGG